MTRSLSTILGSTRFAVALWSLLITLPMLVSTACSGGGDDGDMDAAADGAPQADGGEDGAQDATGDAAVDADTPFTGPRINEFVLNHTGMDSKEFVEILADASQDLSTLSIVIVEGDAGQNPGRVEKIMALGTADANGLFVTPYSADIENDTTTILLVSGMTAIVDADLDLDDDGALDTPLAWTALQDGVAVTDGDPGDRTYAMPLSKDFDGAAFVVGGASRIPNGTHTRSSANWVRNDFDGAGLPDFGPGTPVAGESMNTPGLPNVLPE